MKLNKKGDKRGVTTKYNHSLVLRLYDTGISYKEISEKANVPVEIIRSIIVTRNKRREKHLQKSGEKHNRAKLTEIEAIEIIRLAQNGEEYLEIANKYNLEKSTPRDICTGKTWKHLKSIRDERPIPIRKRKKTAYKNIQFHVHYPTPICLTCEKPLPCNCMKQLKRIN